MTNLKVAIVGTGKVTWDNYLPCLVEETGISLGYYNRTQAKASACEARFGGQVFESISKLMEWQPDTVLILTGEQERFEAASTVLEGHPKRIFFEKPLTAHNGQANVTEQDFFDGQCILQKAEQIGCDTAMVFNYRFFEHSILAKKIIAERAFGRVLNVSGLVHYACWSHSIDLVHFFAGPIDEVSALEGKAVYEGGGMRARDVTLAFRTAEDATGSLIGTNSLAWPFPLFDLNFNFENGRIRIQDLDGEMVVMDSRGMEVESYRIVSDRSRWTQYDSSFKKSLHAYLESIRTNFPVPVPGKYGLLELQVEAGIKRSIAQARPVKLAKDFPLNLKD
jgi:predicted dehydrogenase